MREERLLRDFPRCEHYLLRAFKGRTLADSEAAAGDSSLRGFFRLRERRGCCGSFLVAGTLMREERLLRDFPRCEHYLLRAFKGWTLADSEASCRGNGMARVALEAAGSHSVLASINCGRRA
jgi:hypothetical protein